MVDVSQLNIELIKNKIFLKGMSQRAFAEFVGISSATLSLFLTGKNKPSGRTAGKIAKGLNIKVEELFLP